MSQERKRQWMGSTSHSFVKIQHLLSLVVSPTLCWSGYMKGLMSPSPLTMIHPAITAPVWRVFALLMAIVCAIHNWFYHDEEKTWFILAFIPGKEKVENLLVGVYPGKRLSSSFSSREPVVFSEPMKMMLHRHWWWFRQVRYPTVNCTLAISHL